MASLTLRSSKGSTLTNNEVDGNFTSLNTAKYESGDSPSFATVTTTSTLTVGGGSILSTSAAVSAAGSDQSGATALTKQVMIKSIIEGVKPEAYRSFNVDEGEE